MEEEELKFPIKLEDLLSYTFNFDNLIKALTFLHNNDINLLSNLKDFDKRISPLENLKNDIEEIKIQAKNIQNANDNLNRSLQIMQERFMKMDYKMTELDKKISENKSTMEEQSKNIQLHSKNLDHLNKVVEDNIKKANSMREDIEVNKKQVFLLNETIVELKKKDKDIESLIHAKTELLNARIDENKNEIVELDNNMEELKKNFSELKKETEIKNEEFENSISNIINNISSGNIGNANNKRKSIKEDENAGLFIKTINDNILLNSKIAEIEKEQNNFKDFITMYNSDKANVSNNIQNNVNNIINIHKDINNIKNEMESIINEVSDIKSNQLGNIDLSKYATNDIVKKLSDNIRILNSSLGTTPTRDEFESSIRKINTRLELIEFIQQGVTSGPRTMINSDLVQVQKEGEKGTYITASQKILLPLKEEGKMGNMDDIKKLILATINEEIKNISLLNNPKFSEIFQNLSKCEEEISKNDSSIISIRKILAVSPTQSDILMTRQDIERLSDETKKKFNEILMTINGDEDDEDEEEENKNGLAGFCLKKKIDILISKYHELFNKITSVQNKSNALSREIKEEVKQNLKAETLKVVEDFKQKLENFTSKFEIELRSKIDRGGLNIFEDKLNSKLKIDLKEKLDRIELKKNNYVIKRKIDSLENKISKTLVDTIIDLQMDEAPLIVKKNAQNFELCASCNQIVKKGNSNYLDTDRNFYKSNKNNKGKNTFRNNSNHHMSLNLNINQSNTNSNNKKLPGILSYTQSK